MIETLPVIHIFYNHRVINLFSSKVADPNCRSCHSKVIFGNLGTSLGKYRAEDYCPEGRSTEASTATCFTISYMPLLLYLRNVLLLETEKTQYLLK